MSQLNPQSQMGMPPGGSQPLPGGMGMPGMGGQMAGNGPPLCPCCGQPMPMPNVASNGPQVQLPPGELGLQGMGSDGGNPDEAALSSLIMALMNGGGGMR